MSSDRESSAAVARRAGGYRPDKTAQELLEEFQLTGRQEPFEEIVRRYAGMVFHVCLKVTRNNHDAEDATQAVFLTLAVKGKTTGHIKYIGPWLQQVAHRLALDLKRSKTRRGKREEKHSEMETRRKIIETPAQQLDLNELRIILRDEVDKLPAKYRLPLILHYFGGLKPEEMAKELGTKPSTLGVRLHRGRKMLADSLTARGIDMSGAVLGAMLFYVVQQSIGDTLISRTSAAAVGYAAGHDMGAHIAANVISLANGAQHALTMARIKGAVATVLLFGATVTAGKEVLSHVSLSLPFRIPSLSEWLRPMMRSLLPTMHAQAEPDSKFREEVAAIATLPTATDSAWGNWVSGPLSAMGRDEPTGGAIYAFEAIPQPAAPLDPPTVQTSAIVVVKPPIAPTPAKPAAALPGSFAISSFVNRSTAITPRPMSGTNIVLGNSAGSNQTLVINRDTTFRAPELIVGKSGSGRVVQNGGTVELTKALVLGETATGRGVYELIAGRLSAPREIIGDAGRGTFTQAGGTNIVAGRKTGVGELNIACKPGSVGRYELIDGSLIASHIVVGDAGKGSFRQTGGRVTTSSVRIGQQPTGDGVTRLERGVFNVTPDVTAIATIAAGSVASVAANTKAPTLNPPVGLVVGGRGKGEFVLGSADSTTLIQSAGSNATLVVRADAAAQGTIRGWGGVNLTGPIVQNGRIIADGGGEPRSLDFSTAGLVRNTINNAAIGGTNGWYAVNHGVLDLPPLAIDGKSTVAWGDTSGDAKNDLVNSVKLSAKSVATAGTASIRLLAADSGIAPALPAGTYPVGLWQLSSNDALQFANADVSIRYDDRLINLLGQSESAAELWSYTNGEWSTAAATLDEGDKLITANIAGDAAFFAVAVPPSPLLAAIGGVDVLGGVVPIGSGDLLGAVATVTADSSTAAAFQSSQPTPEPAAVGLILGAGYLLARRTRKRTQTSKLSA